jgi:hypothetical protein
MNKLLPAITPWVSHISPENIVVRSLYKVLRDRIQDIIALGRHGLLLSALFKLVNIYLEIKLVTERKTYTSAAAAPPPLHPLSYDPVESHGSSVVQSHALPHLAEQQGQE